MLRYYICCVYTINFKTRITVTLITPILNFASLTCAQTKRIFL